MEENPHAIIGVGKVVAVVDGEVEAGRIIQLHEEV